MIVRSSVVSQALWSCDILRPWTTFELLTFYINSIKKKLRLSDVVPLRLSWFEFWVLFQGGALRWRFNDPLKDRSQQRALGGKLYRLKQQDKLVR